MCLNITSLLLMWHYFPEANVFHKGSFENTCIFDKNSVVLSHKTTVKTSVFEMLKVMEHKL